MEILNGFKTYLKQEGKRKNTIDAYIRNIEEYLNVINNNIITRDAIMEYKQYLKDKKKDAKTINQKLSSLKKYNEYLILEGVQQDNVVISKDFMKIQKQQISPTEITKRDITKFLKSIKEKESLRNYTLIVLLMYTGLRISEALNLKHDDINLDDGECMVRNGKGEKQRSVLLNSTIINILKQYINNKQVKSEYLFSTKTGNKLARQNVNPIFNKYSKKITPHQLRHYFATNTLEHGIGIHEVAYLMGHSDISTTMIYTNPNKQALKSKIELI